jgi:hypothetical protein
LALKTLENLFHVAVYRYFQLRFFIKKTGVLFNTPVFSIENKILKINFHLGQEKVVQDNRFHPVYRPRSLALALARFRHWQV